jgi:hypothetical protein
VKNEARSGNPAADSAHREDRDRQKLQPKPRQSSRPAKPIATRGNKTPPSTKETGQSGREQTRPESRIPGRKRRDPDTNEPRTEDGQHKRGGSLEQGHCVPDRRFAQIPKAA